MRSRHSALVFGAVMLLALALPPAARASQQESAFSDEEIKGAVAVVKRDPNLGGERTVPMLRWREPEQKPRDLNLGWMKWISGFFGWTMQSARYLMWAGLLFLAAWLGVYLWRTYQAAGGKPEAADTFVPPTHVRNLDIRPQSLPANIGATARGLWDRGEHRAALSLLYRGLLSRLTHVHRVPIKDSSTEGDCLSLLAGHVPPKTGEYSGRLIDAWGGFVYGGTEAPTPAIHALCDGFAAALDRAAARPIEGGGQ